MAGFGQISGMVLKTLGRRLRYAFSLVLRNPLNIANQTPARLLLAPVDLRQPDEFVGSEIIAGRFQLGGAVFDAKDQSPFITDHGQSDFSAKLHAFRWLRHVRASKDPLAAERAQQLTDEWMAINLKRPNGFAWDFEITIHRLIAFLSHSPLILEKADQDFYQRFLICIGQHVRTLRRNVPIRARDVTMLHARIALAMASVCLPSSKSHIRSTSAALSKELSRQIIPDGGHISRNPQVLLDLLADLLPLRQTYVNLDEPLPDNLASIMDQMFVALRFFRHSSGDLALFNGSSFVSANYLMAILQNDEKSQIVNSTLDDSKFVRLEAKRAIVLSDIGTAPKGELSANAHAGCLSFEFSSGGNRLIVNSGSPTFRGADFGSFSRLTAAHSTLVVNDTSSARISQSTILGPVFEQQPNLVIFKTEDSEEYSAFTASHDGYASEYNIVHKRQIRLQNDGRLLSGLDIIEPAKSGEISNQTVTIRFHIHPSIDAYKSENGMIVMSAKDGERWAFTSTLAAELEKDIFFSGLLGQINSQQITLTFKSGDERKAAWIFKALHTSLS